MSGRDVPGAVLQGRHVSRETMEDLETFAAHLERWQKAVNLVAAATLPRLWTRHILDSLQLLPLAPPHALIWADFGSGGGFPGVVLAIALKDRPGAHVHLYESDQRKAAFLREALRLTGAPGTVHAERGENAAPFPADVVTARALAPLDRLFEWTCRFWGAGTLGLFPKGQNLETEIESARKRWRFDYDRIASHTDSSGTILAVRSLGRV